MTRAAPDGRHLDPAVNGAIAPQRWMIAMRGEADRLREQTDRACRASVALADAASHSCAASETIRAAAQRTRVQWHTWRTGLAALRQRADRQAGAPVLRICMLCERVCFAPVGADGSVECWVVPPAWIQARFRSGWGGPALSHGVCPRCVPELYAALGEVPGPMTVDDAPASAVDVLQPALSDIGAAAASVVASMDWLQGDAAVAAILEAAVDELVRHTPTDDVAVLIAALDELARELRRSRATREDGHGRADAVRFRPPLAPG